MTYELSINKNGKKETIPFLYLMDADTEFIRVMKELLSQGWEMERLDDLQRKFTKDDEWVILTIYMYTC